MNWIEYIANIRYKDEKHYPPEGVEVVVTDGKSIDVMWVVYSGGASWCWSNPEGQDGFSDGIPFQPTHWLSEEDSIRYIREDKLKIILEH